MFLDTICADVRYSLRTVFARRVFTAAAVACLSLAIATASTVFSVFDAMFLRPLPFRDAEALVSITGRHPQTGQRVPLSQEDIRELRAGLHSLDVVAAYSGRTVTLSDGGEPERISGQSVTSDLFSLLGVRPQRGRAFSDVDDQGPTSGSVLISDALWQRRYDRDPSVVGRVVQLDAVPFTIVGVMPPLFRFPSTTDLWLPMTPAGSSPGASSRGVSALGHLTRGATVGPANAELSSRVLPPTPTRGPRTGLARPLRAAVTGGEERTIIWALMGATTLLVLIACVNLANLMLARGAGRRREIAVRATLGASRSRIARQLVTESLLIALMSAGAAVPLAGYGIHWLHKAVPPTDPLGPYYMDWSLDWRTMVYAVVVSVLAGLAFGLVPALDATGRRLLAPLREKSGAAGGRLQRRAHSALIVAQTALAILLLAGASLFVRTYVGLATVSLGYDPSRLMTARFYFSGAAYDLPERRARAVDEIARRLRSIPGAEAATVTDLVPLDDQGGSDAPAEVEGRVFDEGREPTVHYAGVAGRWTETFAARPVVGRTFEDHELSTVAPVALVNRTLAKTFWPGQSPLGRRFRLQEDPPGPWFTVIGVVADLRTVKLDESRETPPTAYLPHRFVTTRNWGIVVRTRAHPESVTPEVRAAVHAIDPSLAVFDVYSMDQVRWLSYWMYIMWGTLFGVLGAVAMLLAAIGVYGVVFYTVGQRTREIGIRVAVGARRGQIVRPMLGHVGLLSAVGAILGLTGAWAVTPLVGALLIGVSPNDTAGLVGVATMLTAVALVAAWVPAWRASGVDPVIALRDE
jgi:putative ABC transport system permease protein